MIRTIFSRKVIFRFFRIFFHILDIPNHENVQMYKKGSNHICLATFLLILFIEEYYNKDKF